MPCEANRGSLTIQRTSLAFDGDSKRSAGGNAPQARGILLSSSRASSESCRGGARRSNHLRSKASLLRAGNADGACLLRALLDDGITGRVSNDSFLVFHLQFFCQSI